MTVRIQSRLFRPGFRGAEAAAFARWAVALLARGRDGAGAATEWHIARRLVSFDDEQNPRDVLEAVTLETEDGLSLVCESRWQIHWSDSIGGMQEHVAGPVERYHAELAAPLRFDLSEECDAKGWARALDVRSRRPSITSEIRARFREEIANPKRIPPWEVRRVLAEEVAAADGLADRWPDRGDHRRAAAARVRELLRAERRALPSDVEEMRWRWPWTEGGPAPPPRPAAVSVASPPAPPTEPVPERAAPPAEPPATSWVSLAPHGEAPILLADFLVLLGRLYTSRAAPLVPASPTAPALDDSRWNHLSFALDLLRGGRSALEWRNGERVLRLTLDERPAGPYGMDPAPQEPGVWYEIRADGLAPGVVLEACTLDDPRLSRLRTVGPDPHAGELRAEILQRLATLP